MSSSSATRESGFVLVILMTAIIPLVAMAAAAMLTLGGRNQRIMNEVQLERALLAAEAGIDEAVYAAKTGALVHATPIERDFGKGSKFVIQATHLQMDGVDNDGDGDVDTADPDEDVFQVVVTGQHRGAKRRLAAFLGRKATLPVPEAAGYIAVPPSNIDIGSSGVIDGNNTNLDGSSGDPAETVHGLTIAPPHTLNDITSQLSSGETPLVIGVGSAPSALVASSAVDMSTLIADLTASATTALTSSNYTDTSIGNGIAYRNGNLTLDDSTGSGILVVSGDLLFDDACRFDGVIVVGGKFLIRDDSKVYGAVFCGGNEFKVQNNARLRFSKEALQIAEGLSSPYTKLQGWQEISSG